MYHNELILTTKYLFIITIPFTSSLDVRGRGKGEGDRGGRVMGEAKLVKTDVPVLKSNHSHFG